MERTRTVHDSIRPAMSSSIVESCGRHLADANARSRAGVDDAATSARGVRCPPAAHRAVNLDPQIQRIHPYRGPGPAMPTDRAVTRSRRDLPTSSSYQPGPNATRRQSNPSPDPPGRPPRIQPIQRSRQTPVSGGHRYRARCSPLHAVIVHHRDGMPTARRASRRSRKYPPANSTAHASPPNRQSQR